EERPVGRGGGGSDEELADVRGVGLERHRRLEDEAAVRHRSDVHGGRGGPRHAHGGKRGAPYSPPVENPAAPRALLFEFPQSDALRKHGRAVEEAMLAYARWFGEIDPEAIERWGIVGLLHDFDYEKNPTEETHLHVGARVMRERGWPEEIIDAICSHADYMKIPRDTPLKKSIYACDELVGFIGACVKVRPSKKIADLPVESVVKKLKDKAFARSVDRSYVYGGAEAIGRPLAEHVGFLIEALKPIADEIGL